MSVETTATTPVTEVQAPAVSATGAETPIQAAATTPAETVEELRAEVARMAKALKEANKEDATRRKKLADFEKAEQERAQATMSEMDKLKAQLAERDKAVADAKAAQERAQVEAEHTKIKATIMAQAAQLGFNDAEDAYALIDLAAVTVDEDKINGVQEALAALAKRKPYMLKASTPRPPQVSPTNPGQQASDGMTDEQIRATVFGGGPTNLFTAAGAKNKGGGVVWTTKTQ
jgi:hypothetical protein